MLLGILKTLNLVFFYLFEVNMIVYQVSKQEAIYKRKIFRDKYKTSFISSVRFFKNRKTLNSQYIFKIFD